MTEEELLRHSTIEAMADRNLLQFVDKAIISAADPKLEVTRRDRAAHAVASALIGLKIVDPNRTALTSSERSQVAHQAYALADEMEQAR